MRRTVCRGCESANIEEILNLGQVPLAGGFLSGKDAIADEKLYPLPVDVCADCGLVQIVEVVDPEVLFQDYSFSSSTIGPLVKHFEAYAGWLHDKFKPENIPVMRFVLTVGREFGVQVWHETNTPTTVLEQNYALILWRTC